MLIHETILTTKPHSSIRQTKIKGSLSAARFLRKIWPSDIRIRERCFAIYLNEMNIPLTWMEVSAGGVSSMLVDIKMVLIPALQISGCTKIILGHNHPSGVTKPSPSDQMITFQLREVCGLMGLQLVAHLVIVERGFEEVVFK